MNCAATPRFVGCFDAPPCIADEVSYFTEGDNVRFNISVGYIPGGLSGQQQDVRLVSLLRGPTTLVNCINTVLNSCLVNPTLSEDVVERLAFRRDESDPWFDIEINITNAVTNDSGLYHVVLEVDDVSATNIVTRSTSTVTVSVTPTPSLPVIPTSSKQIAKKIIVT